MSGKNSLTPIASKTVLNRIAFGVSPDCIERTALVIENPAVRTLDLTPDQRAKALKAVKSVVRRLKFRTFLFRERLRVEIFAMQIRGSVLQILGKIVGNSLDTERNIHSRIIPDRDA